MSNDPLTGSGKSIALKVLLIQTSFVIFATFIILLTMNLKASITLFAGGMIGVIPAWVFAKQAFRYAGARQARQVVRAFYLGEALKLTLTLLLFVLVFSFVNVSAGLLLSGYAIALIAHWVSLGLLKEKTTI